MSVTILGCGPSGGVPLIGNDWGECDPANPRNRRRRASILVEQSGAKILVDASPDMRMQLLDAGISRLDPSGSTTSNSAAPCRRMLPSTGNCRPSNGCRGRVSLTVPGCTAVTGRPR